MKASASLERTLSDFRRFLGNSLKHQLRGHKFFCQLGQVQVKFFWVPANLWRASRSGATEPILQQDAEGVCQEYDEKSPHIEGHRTHHTPRDLTPMFGKTKDSASTSEQRADLVIDDFFGDEAAVAEAERIDKLHQRMTGVEQQLNSQFTSMAAYAQIAQEQIELVRAESQNANERSEQRVISLIERERNDRLNGEGLPSGGVTARLDALENQVVELRESLQQCLSNQKALADAITDLFSRPGAITTIAHTPVDETPAPADTEQALAEPVVAEPIAPEPTVTEEAAPIEPAAEPVIVEPADALLPGTDTFTDDDVFGGEFTPIETHEMLLADTDDLEPIVANNVPVAAAIDTDFGVFAAPDIATIEPMASLPAPVLGDEHAAPIDMPAPALNDGPIAELSLD